MNLTRYVIPLYLAFSAAARAQTSSATIAGVQWTLRSDVSINATRASATIGGARCEFIPQTVGDPFSGISTAGAFTLVSGGASRFYSDRLDDYAIWARGEFADPALPSAQQGADADADGADNFLEWLSLTDPENAASRLRLEISLLSPAQVRLTLEPYFPEQRNYAILHSATLGGFSVLDADLGAASDSPPRSQKDYNIAPGEPADFFRARLSVKP